MGGSVSMEKTKSCTIHESRILDNSDIYVAITTDDFKGSKYIDFYDCPLARALKKILPGHDITVTGGYARIMSSMYLIPDSVLWARTAGILIQKANQGEEASFAIMLKFKG
jgi:hypothetical protein